MNLQQDSFYSRTDPKYQFDSNSKLANKITVLAAHIDVATYSFLKMINEFDHRKAWGKSGIGSCSHWVSWKCNIAYSTAREKVRVAHCLERLPKINVAFESGKLSYSQVRALTRIATDENEADLLDMADHKSASRLDQLVCKHQPVDEDQQPIDQIDEYEKRRLECFQDKDGMWVFRGRLPQVEGGLLSKAIDEIMRQQRQSEKKEKDSGESSKSSKSAKPRIETELIGPDIVEHATIKQRKADALLGMGEWCTESEYLEHYVSHEVEAGGRQDQQ
jgi:hypothetical protein